MKKLALVLITVLWILALPAPSWALPEIPLATNAASEVHPDIYNRRVVYELLGTQTQNNSDGSSFNYNVGDIYMYDKETGLNTAVTTNTADQRSPAVWGKRIVWGDGRNDPLNPYYALINKDIYMYTIGGGETPLVTAVGNQFAPDIYGDRVVWLDDRDGGRDIYLKDILTGIESRITASGVADRPAIYGDKIVWSERSSTPFHQIYLYDLSVDSNSNGIPNYLEAVRPFPDPAQRSLTSYSGNYQESPKIYRDTVVWVDSRNGYKRDVYGYNLLTETESRITTGTTSMKDSPAVWGQRVVWEEDVIDGMFSLLESNIKMYTLWGGPTEAVSNATGIYSQYPSFFGNIAVWQDDRVNWPKYDIYKAYKTTDWTDSTPPAQVTGLSVTDPQIGGMLNLNWSAPADTDISGYKVYWSTTSAGPYTAVDAWDKTSYSFTGLTNGLPYYFRVSAYDTSDNNGSNSTEQSGTPTTDVTPPDTAITAPAAAATLTTSPQLITGTASDNKGVQSVEAQLKRSSDYWTGSAWTSTLTWLPATITSGAGTASANWQYSLTLPDSDNGVFTIRARARDLSGNYDATPAAQTNIIDNTAPTGGTISISSGAANTATATVTLNSLAATDGGGVSQMRFSNNGVLWSSWEATATVKSGWILTDATYGGTSANGIKTAYVQYRDTSGNASVSFTDTIFYDSVVPTAGISAPSGYSTTATVPLVWNGVDPVPSSGLANYDIQYRFNGGVWTNWQMATALTSGNFIAPSGEGTYAWQARSRDNAGNVGSYTQSSNLVYDKTGPTDPSTFTSTDTTGTWLGHNRITVNWAADATDTLSGVDGYSVDFDTATVPITPPSKNVNYGTNTFQSAALPDGTSWYAHIRTVDKAGNWTMTKNIGPFKVDTAVPNAFSISSPASNNWSSSAAPAFSWSAATDGASGVAKYQLYVDGLLNRDNILTTSSIPTGTLSEGAHTWFVKAVDGAGNSRQSTETWTIKIDTTIPGAFTLSAPADGSPQATATPALSWNASSDTGAGLAKYQLFIDGSLNRDNISTSTTSALPVSGLSDGLHNWFVKAVDAMGNARQSSDTRAFTIDTTAPTGGTISISSGAANTATATVTLSSLAATDSGGVSQMRFSNNGALWSSWEATATVKTGWILSNVTYGGTTANGTKTVYVQYRDPSNNASASFTDTIFYDSVVPTASFTPPAAYSTTATIPLAWSGTDPAPYSGIVNYDVQYRFMGGAWSDWRMASTLTTDTFTAGGEGTYAWQVRARDNAGNVGNYTPTSNLIYDTTAPSAPPSVTDDGDTTNVTSELHVVWTVASDTVSGIASYEYSIGTSEGATNTVNWTYNGSLLSVTKSGLSLSQGTTYYVNVRAKNGAGIYGAVRSSDGILVDQVPINWYIRRAVPGGFEPTSAWSKIWGLSGDTTLVGDFDGDGRKDIAVYRPGSITNWFFKLSTGSDFAPQTFSTSWGDTSGDTPFVGDFNGDGKTDIGIYRKGTYPNWFVRINTGAPGNVSWAPTSWSTPWGNAGGDTPIVGDFNGDGRADIGIYRTGSYPNWFFLPTRSDGAWFGAPQGTWALNWGNAGGDTPIIGDFSGDGKVDIGIYRTGSYPNWFFLRANSNGVGFMPAQNTWALSWGNAGGDLPIVGDFNGDRIKDIGIFRISGYPNWFTNNSLGIGFDQQTDTSSNWGNFNTDRPIIGDFSGDGRDDLGIVRR